MLNLFSWYRRKKARQSRIPLVVQEIKFCEKLFSLSAVDIALWTFNGAYKADIAPLLNIQDTVTRRKAVVETLKRNGFITEHKIQWFLSNPEHLAKFNNWLEGDNHV